MKIQCQKNISLLLFIDIVIAIDLKNVFVE